MAFINRLFDMYINHNDELVYTSALKVNSSITRKEINMHLKFPQILFDTMAKEAHDKGTSVAAFDCKSPDATL